MLLTEKIFGRTVKPQKVIAHRGMSGKFPENTLPEFRKALRLSRQILAQDAMLPFYDHEIQPGAKAVTDADLDVFIQRQAESAYHPCGTCRMGSEKDALAVVSPDCRVIGAINLFCADSSLFPRITKGNLNAPSIMVGEKAADHILKKLLLSPTNDEPFKHPDWQLRQR